MLLGGAVVSILHKTSESKKTTNSFTKTFNKEVWGCNGGGAVVRQMRWGACTKKLTI